uniref:Uncharacterized protein n=1 Tax=uncultured Desulfobacterium sp. TaxID=201089 RepID=E1YFJ4_9BACT|nr:unknown protein [uncultured Desulfobacterium sp.]
MRIASNKILPKMYTLNTKGMVYIAVKRTCPFLLFATRFFHRKKGKKLPDRVGRIQKEKYNQEKIP